MGRLIAVVLFIAVMVPAGLLARAWGLASGRRAVARAGVQWATSTEAGTRVLARQARHGRLVRRLGFGLGLVAIVGSVVLYAEGSVFLWVPLLVGGLLVGVLLGEATRPRPAWEFGRPLRRPRRSDQISLWLLFTMRAVVLGALVAAGLQWGSGELDGAVAPAVLAVPAVCWLLAEVALVRVLLRPLPAEGADVPVDEALRTATAHVAVAAASVVGLLTLGGLLLVAGLGLGDRAGSGVDLLPVALVAGGFSALTASVAVAAFLVPWLRPVQRTEPALAG
ncbi:hypothetical protein GB931_16075 [Modestobacter sp. I12A-02628]|uniref:Uncharacterized protein n=1 Tax=Goekera deserti TaxID=2497753 RepID=A0A7K3WGR5_9ACTN|nr:hypothetical protein [Goekera deserti]MPQ99408.1 hypothetical protein [Goekera deserti]NDI48895.1 hypothetical protein [Goekera deserti]NEL55634.1 hypothetical protein [Goekera deserti]